MNAAEQTRADYVAQWVTLGASLIGIGLIIWSSTGGAGAALASTLAWIATGIAVCGMAVMGILFLRRRRRRPPQRHE